MTFDKMKEVFDELHESIKEGKMLVDDKESLELEATVGSDTAGNQHVELGGSSTNC